MKKLILILTLLTAVSTEAIAAKALVQVQNITRDQNGQFWWEGHIISDTGRDNFSNGPINPVSSVPTMINDIKAGARQVIIDVGGPSIPNADITVLGGPQ